MGSTQEHSKLVNDILIALGLRPELGRWWKNPTGAIQDESGRYIRYGLVGSPDIVGLTNKGTFCGIEVKTGHAVFGKHQKIFKAMIETNRGIVLEGRSVQQVLLDIQRLCF